MGSTERRWFSLLILGLTVSYSHSSRQQPSFELQARFLLKNHFCTMTKFKRLQIDTWRRASVWSLPGPKF